MTPPRKRPAGPARPRTTADWDLPELDLYVGGRHDPLTYVGGRHDPLTFWEAHRASLVVLVVVGLLLVAWLVWGGRG